MAEFAYQRNEEAQSSEKRDVLSAVDENPLRNGSDFTPEESQRYEALIDTGVMVPADALKFIYDKREERDQTRTTGPISHQIGGAALTGADAPLEPRLSDEVPKSKTRIRKGSIVVSDSVGRILHETRPNLEADPYQSDPEIKPILDDIHVDERRRFIERKVAAGYSLNQAQILYNQRNRKTPTHGA